MTGTEVAKRLRPFAWGLAAAGLVAIVVWRVGAWGPGSRASSGRAVAGDPAEPGLALYPAGGRANAPTLEGTTLNGASFSLSALRGRVVVVNVWGSWCGPCRAETPDLVRLANKYSNQGVSFIGVDTRDNSAAARAFVRKFHVPYPSVEDEGGRLLLAFKGLIPTSVVPSSVVIDRNGGIAARIIGRVGYSTLDGILSDETTGAGGSDAALN